MTFSAFKVVNSLPSILEKNSIYLVRSGVGFDFYCSDSTGSIAHEINKPNSINNIDGGLVSDVYPPVFAIDGGSV